MKFSRQELFKRMRKRILIYGLTLVVLFGIIFVAAGNSVLTDIDVFLVVVMGASLFLAIIISIFGLFWEMAYGDEDLRDRKKSAK
jgi:predicted tellurium resistance membrane protein TerC